MPPKAGKRDAPADDLPDVKKAKPDTAGATPGAAKQPAGGPPVGVPVAKKPKVENDVSAEGTESHVPWGATATFTVTKEDDEKLGMTVGRDMVVKIVGRDSPAERAGIGVGMLVTSVNGQTTGSTAELMKALGTCGNSFTVSAKQRPEYHTYTIKVAKADITTPMGMTLGPDMVVTELAEGGLLKEAGVKTEHRVLEINGIRISTPHQAADLLSSSKGEVTVKITDAPYDPKDHGHAAPSSSSASSPHLAARGRGGKGRGGGRGGKGGRGAVNGAHVCTTAPSPAPATAQHRPGKGGMSGVRGGKGVPASSYGATRGGANPMKAWQPPQRAVQPLPQQQRTVPQQWQPQHQALPTVSGKAKVETFFTLVNQRFPNALPTHLKSLYTEEDFAAWTTKGMADLQQELSASQVDPLLAAPLQNMAKKIFADSSAPAAATTPPRVLPYTPPMHTPPPQQVRPPRQSPPPVSPTPQQHRMKGGKGAKGLRGMSTQVAAAKAANEALATVKDVEMASYLGKFAAAYREKASE